MFGISLHNRRLRRRSQGRRLLFNGGVLLLLLPLACAQMAPPSGGPEDKTAPFILSHNPDSSAVKVAIDEPLVFEFSEKMNHSTVRDWLLITPWPDRMDCHWDHTTLTCTPTDGWQEETAYTILLGSLVADRRRNTLENPFDFSFTTGDSLPAGVVFGQLLTRSIPDQGITICLFEWPDSLDPALLEVPEADGAPGPDPRAAIRISQTDQTGSFTLKHVPSRTEFLLGALYDENDNRTFDEDKDLWGFAPRRITAAIRDPADSTATGEDLYLVFGDEPGDINGTISDSTCLGFVPPTLVRARIDSLKMILSGDLDVQGFATGTDSLAHLALTPLERDSISINIDQLGNQLETSLTDSLRCSASIYCWLYIEEETEPFAEIRTGADFIYEARSLPPGLYRIEAFRDLNNNKSPDQDEPLGHFGFPIELAPGRVIQGVDIELESHLREVDRSGK